MVSRRPAEERHTADAAEFVRFCYRRRRAGWPELYDEMCAVASRGLFRGWGPSELAEHGVGFSLFETAALAALVGRVVAEERERTRRPIVFTVEDDMPEMPAAQPAEIPQAHEPTEVAPLRLAGAALG
jgi:hypothetical protein